MPRKGLLAASVIVILANVAAWSVATLSRRGEPDAVLVLTERELRLPVREAENTALALSLVFEPTRTTAATEPADSGWFDREKLESIGFDCSRPVDQEHAAYYRTRPPRSTFAALELAEAAATDSHLNVVDVDNDAAALRRRHPDRSRVAVVEGTAILRYVSKPGQSPFLAGRVVSVLPSEINVPREWRGLLTALQPDKPSAVSPPGREPRYRVTVAWGRRLEPWITNVEMLK
jgi:hypothetical protein